MVELYIFKAKQPLPVSSRKLGNFFHAPSVVENGRTLYF